MQSHALALPFSLGSCLFVHAAIRATSLPNQPVLSVLLMALRLMQDQASVVDVAPAPVGSPAQHNPF